MYYLIKFWVSGNKLLSEVVYQGDKEDELDRLKAELSYEDQDAVYVAEKELEDGQHVYFQTKSVRSFLGEDRNEN